jgi:hypothetical protein
MTISAWQGPIISFGQTNPPDYNPSAASSLFWAGTALLDPRPQFNYDTGAGVSSGVYGWAGDSTSIISLYGVPQTKTTNLLAAAQHTTNGTAMTLASAAATGLNVGVTVARIDTGVNVTGLLEIDPLVISCTANVTSGSNILTVTAMGTGTAYHPLGLTPNVVLTDSTHASAIPTGTYITGFVSGGGGIGTYTMSANAASSQTGDTVTGILTATPHAQAFGQDGTVRLWNPAAMLSRVLIVTASSASAATTTFTINGLDVYGQPMTEQIVVTPASATTTTGLKAWKWIKSITPNATDATYNWSVGTTDLVGLPIRSDNFQTGAVLDLSLMMNNALITATTGYVAAVKTTATATTGDVRGTYSLQTSSNGTLLVAATHAPLTPNLNSAIGLYGVPQYTAW